MGTFDWRGEIQITGSYVVIPVNPSDSTSSIATNSTDSIDLKHSIEPMDSTISMDTIDL